MARGPAGPAPITYPFPFCKGPEKREELSARGLDNLDKMGENRRSGDQVALLAGRPCDLAFREVAPSPCFPPPPARVAV